MKQPFRPHMKRHDAQPKITLQDIADELGAEPTEVRRLLERRRLDTLVRAIRRGGES